MCNFWGFDPGTGPSLDPTQKKRGPRHRKKRGHNQGHRARRVHAIPRGGPPKTTQNKRGRMLFADPAWWRYARNALSTMLSLPGLCESQPQPPPPWAIIAQGFGKGVMARQMPPIWPPKKSGHGAPARGTRGVAKTGRPIQIRFSAH